MRKALLPQRPPSLESLLGKPFLHRRHWKGAHDSTSEVFQVASPELPVHECVCKVLEKMLLGERLGSKVEGSVGSAQCADVEIDETK